MCVCVQNSWSGAGTGVQQGCVCNAGYVGANGGTCYECGTDRWCPGGNASYACKANSTSVHMSQSERECTCVKGFAETAGGVCEECQVGEWCSAGIASTCVDTGKRVRVC